MTTVIAVQCRDGVVLCADTQETSDYTKESVSKIHPVTYGDRIDEHCILGCAGVSQYITLFREHIGNAFFNRGGMTCFEALDNATCSYTKYIQTRSGRMGGVSFEGNEYPSAIFVGCAPPDDKIRVYVLEPPHPPYELSAPYRKSIGIGFLYSTLLFGMAETLMNKIGLNWPQLSTKLVAQFCYLVLGRVMNYDKYSGMGATIYKVDKTRGTLLYNEQMFPGHGTGERYRLSVFIKTLLDELPKEKLPELIETYNVYDIVRQMFVSLSADSPSGR